MRTITAACGANGLTMLFAKLALGSSRFNDYSGFAHSVFYPQELK